MSTYDDKLRLAKPAGGDDAWTTEINQNWDVIGDVVSPSATYLVSPNFSDAVLHNASATDRRHFNTIMGAISAAESKGGWGDFGYTVLVWPGQYHEKVEITDYGCALIGMGQGTTAYGGGGVWIRGDGTQNPTITIDPPNGSVQRVALHNLIIDNDYDTDPGSEIDNAYAILINDKQGFESYSGVQNVVSIVDCSIRCQTWGEGGQWKYGIKASGWWDLHFVRSQIGGFKYAGGDGDGYIRYLFGLFGNSGAVKTCTTRVHESYTYTDETASGAPQLRTFYYGPYAHIYVHRSTINQTEGDCLEAASATGCTVVGVSAPQNETHHNVFGEDVFHF